MFVRRLLFCALALAPLALAACTVPQPQAYQRQAQFIEAEYAFSAGTGTGRLTGQAFTKTRGGDVKFAAGNPVYLNPVTSYSAEWFEVNVKQNRLMTQPDPRTEKYRRTTTADGSGNFEFDGLPAGDYYVASSIFWEVPGPNGLSHTGSIVGEKVTIKAGETTKVIVH